MCRIGYIERGREISASDVQDEPVLEANHFIAHKKGVRYLKISSLSKYAVLCLCLVISVEPNESNHLLASFCRYRVSRYYRY